MTILDTEIEKKYESGQNRLITESHRITIPVLLDIFDRGEYIRIKNLYFTPNWSPTWNKKKQSRLIESLIINIPILPIILYEKEETKLYEVIDGKERLEAIKKFDSDRLILTGLEAYPELNGRTYSTLPQKIKMAINRRRLSFIVFLPMNDDVSLEDFGKKLINAAKERL